jgi:hypothetical protein
MNYEFEIIFFLKIRPPQYFLIKKGKLSINERSNSKIRLDIKPLFAKQMSKLFQLPK